MSTQGAEERENRRGLLCGAALALVLSLALYPPLVFGGGLGAWAASELRRRGQQGSWDTKPAGWTILSAGCCVALAVAVGEAVLLVEERREFLRGWNEGGLLRLDPGALLRHPWGWLPQTAAISGLVAGTWTVARGR